MLFRKLWRTMGLYKAQFISMIVMIALGIGMFVGFNMEWVAIRDNTTAFFEETGYADYRIVAESGFTAAQRETVENLSGVDAAARYLSVSADVLEREGDCVALTVTDNAAVSGFLVMQGEAYDADSADGVWLSDKYAAANDFAIGDAITLQYKNIRLAGRVRGLIKSGEHMICVRDESQLMPDFSTYGFSYISPEMYEKALGFAYYPQIHVRSGLEKKAFTEAVDEALGNTPLVLTKDESTAYAGCSGETEEGQTMGAVLPVLFLLIAVLTMVTTMHRLAAKEKTQIGTLKALGFKDRRILRHYTAYAFIIGILGSAIGIGIGYIVAYVIMNPNGAMGTYMDIPEWKLRVPGFCWAVLVATNVLLTFIGFLSVKQMLRGTAADALRPYTPKKVKPLAVERTRWFHRLSFGTRWNLRDIMRHRSRTAMSLIGIVGSMILIIGSLGMGDTMDAFLALYYDGATNYASRIYLTEDATPQQRSAVADRYDGDTSATVSVQLEEKAVSLDIYAISHDLVRFPEEKQDRYVTLADDGAYVCVRLAEEFDLQTGDHFTVSPYGSDEKYTLRVAGVVRSVSESVVISAAYAEKLAIPYTVDSVYTAVDKAAIAAEDAIKSVQSKQMIMDSFDSFLEMMNAMIVVLILGALVLGLVVLYNLGVMSYAERYREMATLKVVGFKDRRIGRLLISQNLWVSVVGVLIGLPLGALTLEYLLHALASEYELRMELRPLSCLLAIVLTVGVSLLVSWLVARKNKKIDMVEALKGAE